MSYAQATRAVPSQVCGRSHARRSFFAVPVPWAGLSSRQRILRVVVGVFVLLALALVVYWPAVHGGFLLDDDVMLRRNALEGAAGGLQRIWFSTQVVDYW